MSGGQVWWEKILGQIRDCEVFVFVIDARSLESVAVSRECDYASALGKPVLPVLVADGVSTNLLRPEIAQLQIIDYRTRDRSTALRLARAFSALPAPMPLPSPLPPPPEVPLSYLGGIAKKLDSTSNLNYDEQSALVGHLRRGLRDRESADDARVLLRRLRQRRDLLVPIADEIDELLGPVQTVRPVDPQPEAHPQPSVAVHSDSVRPSLKTKSLMSPRKGPLAAVAILLTAALLVAAIYLGYALSILLPRSFGFSGSDLQPRYLSGLAIFCSMASATVGEIGRFRRMTKVGTLVGAAIVLWLVENNWGFGPTEIGLLIASLAAGTVIGLWVAAALLKLMTRLRATVARAAADDATAHSG